MVAILAAGGILFGVSMAAANAQSFNTFPGLAQTIANKFNLNQSDVQTLINAYAQQQQQKRLQNLEQIQQKRLDNLVSQGKITSTQETAIINELNALRSQYGPSALKNLTQQQRRQALQARKNALTQWANSQGISLKYILPMRMGMLWRGAKTSPTPTP